MERTYIADIKKKPGESVVLMGFVQTVRNQGSIKFLIVRDITGLMQVVVLKSEKEAFETVDSISIESVVSIEGLVKEEKQAPGGFEVQAKNITILSKSAPELPIPVLSEKSGEETEASKRFDWRWLDLRKEERTKIFKVWSSLEKGFRKYWEDNNFIQVYAPSLMGTASESGSEVFEVKYFDKKAYLAQSPQFYKQMAMASGFERVFMVGPVFRAEPSYTTRHMTEFTGWDYEVSYVESHYDVMAHMEGLLVSGFKELKASPGLDLEVPMVPFPKISIKEAKEILKKEGIKSDKDFDINSDEEKAICDYVKKKYNHDFVFITDWPKEGRPFYHMRHEDDINTTKSADLLYKGLEIVTLAQREHRPEILEKQAIEKNMPLDELKDYINFFRYGCPPHGGAGIGPGRIIMKILDLPSVKEATFLPRDVKRLTP